MRKILFIIIALVFYAQAQNDYYFSFDGVDDYLYMTQSTKDSLEWGTEDFTVAFQLKANGTTGMFMDTYGGSLPRIYYEIRAAGTIAVRYRESGQDATVTTTNSFNDNEWHVVVLRGDRDGNIEWFVDGISEKTYPFHARSLSTLYHFRIGGNVYLGNFTAIELDNYTHWSRALTNTEIIALGAGDVFNINYTKLAFWLSMNEVYGQKTYDQVKNTLMLLGPTGTVDSADPTRVFNPLRKKMGHLGFYGLPGLHK